MQKSGAFRFAERRHFLLETLLPGSSRYFFFVRR